MLGDGIFRDRIRGNIWNHMLRKKNQRPSQLLRKEIYLQSFLQGGGPCFLPSSTLTPSFFVTSIFYMYTSLKNHHVLLQTCSDLRIKLLARYLVGHKPVKKGGFWGPLDQLSCGNPNCKKSFHELPFGHPFRERYGFHFGSVIASILGALPLPFWERYGSILGFTILGCFP